MRQVFNHFKKSTSGLVGSGILLVLILLAVFAPVITPVGYAELKYLDKINNLPSDSNWFGVDSMGRDYFTRVIFGTRISLFIGFTSAIIALVVGVFLGALAGYFKGITDWIIMRLVEIFSVIPTLLIAIFFVTITGGGTKNIIFIIGMVSWRNICRSVRGEIISLKEREFVIAAKAIGAKPIRIIFKHLLPNAIAPIIVGLVLCSSRAIMLEAMLSFLGVGVNPPTPSWGQMISEGLYYIQFYWHLSLFPSIFLVLTVLSLSFIGDGLRDALDPKLRGQR